MDASLAPHQIVMIGVNVMSLVLGAPGNALILRVYFAKARKTSTHILIMGLALSDLAALFLTFPLEVASWALEYRMDGRQALCRLVGFCFHFFAQCSVLITVAIAVDRYHAVCRPHQWKFSGARVQATVLGCFLLSAATSVAPLFSYGVRTVELPPGEAGESGTGANVTRRLAVCDRRVEAGFDRLVFVLHTAWFALLFLVLTAAYLRIYLTIQKRVAASLAGGGADDRQGQSQMRVMRTGIRFISHLTAVAGKDGGGAGAGGGAPAGTGAGAPPRPLARRRIDRNERRSSTGIEHEPITYSTDAENGPTATVSPTTRKPPATKPQLPVPFAPTEDPLPVSAVRKRPVARALLLAAHAGKPSRPVLPSIGAASRTPGQVVNGDPVAKRPAGRPFVVHRESDDDGGDTEATLRRHGGPAARASPRLQPRPVGRKKSGLSGWGTLSLQPAAAGAEAGDEAAGVGRPAKRPAADDVTSPSAELDPTPGPAAKKASPSAPPPIPSSLAKILQRRAAASALNLKMQKKTTNMLLVAAVTAVLTWLPTTVVGVALPDVHGWLLPVAAGGGTDSDWLRVLVCLMGWLFLFNFVTNPFVYSLMNSRFREDCAKSFPVKKFRAREEVTAPSLDK